jgi:hypothetical protein
MGRANAVVWRAVALVTLIATVSLIAVVVLRLSGLLPFSIGVRIGQTNEFSDVGNHAFCGVLIASLLAAGSALLLLWRLRHPK